MELASTSQPLTDEQSRQLIPAILETLRSRTEMAARPRPVDARGWAEFYDANLRALQARLDRITESARTYLSPLQLAQLQELNARKLDSERQSNAARLARLESAR